MEVDINDLASIGAIRDQSPYQLPPEAFNTILNMRCEDGGLVSLPGWEQVFGTPGVAPHFAMALRTNAATMLLYTSLTKAYGFDGTTHTEVTRLAGNYAANDTEDWNGTLLGGIPIINNGVDVPQYWPTIALATKLANLTNWPGTLRAKVVRAFGPHLLAFNITDGGVSYPHLIQWSHPADPGTLPSSWDYTDPTKDAGRKDLPDVDSGVLLDALALGTTMYAYKEKSIWKIRFIGGRFIYDFGQSAWITTVGLLAPRCVATTGDGMKHVLATQDDIIWHDGNQVKSVLNRRQRRRLFNEMDATNFSNSFMFCHPLKGEMWFCYPSSGQTYPDKALIMNYIESPNWTITEADGINFRNAAAMTLENPSDEAWSDGDDAWEEDTGPWSSVARNRIIACAPASTKFFGMDAGATRDGVAFTVTLQREGLSLLGRKRNGDWIVDHQVIKMFQRLWPKIQGGPVRIRCGSQLLVNGPISWSAYTSFDPESGVVGDPGPISGRAMAVEFSTTTAVSWKIDGYKFEVAKLGEF